MNEHVRWRHLLPEASPAAQRRRADHAFKTETYQLLGMLGRDGLLKELRQRQRYASSCAVTLDARQRQLHLIEIVQQVLDEEGERT